MKKVFITIIGAISLMSTYAQAADSIEFVLKKVYETDQGYRQELIEITDKDEQLKAWLKINRQDSVNQSIVFPIIDKLRSGEISDLSPEGYHTCFLVLQHADLDAQLKYFDFVIDGLKEQKLRPLDFIVFIDRVNVRQNQGQAFGSQGLRIANNKIVPYPLKPKAVRDSIAAAHNIDPKRFVLIGGGAAYTDVELPASILEQYNKGQYEPVEVGEGEFVIFGTLYTDQSQQQGLEGAVIKINGFTLARSDANGYFACKILKNNVPGAVVVISYEGKEFTYPLDGEESGGDFRFFSQIVA